METKYIKIEFNKPEYGYQKGDTQKGLLINFDHVIFPKKNAIQIIIIEKTTAEKKGILVWEM